MCLCGCKGWRSARGGASCNPGPRVVQCLPTWSGRERSCEVGRSPASWGRLMCFDGWKQRQDDVTSVGPSDDLRPPRAFVPLAAPSHRDAHHRSFIPPHIWQHDTGSRRSASKRSFHRVSSPAR